MWTGCRRMVSRDIYKSLGIGRMKRYGEEDDLRDEGLEACYTVA